MHFWDIITCLGWWWGAEAEEISLNVAVAIAEYHV